MLHQELGRERRAQILSWIEIQIKANKVTIVRTGPALRAYKGVGSQWCNRLPLERHDLVPSCR